MSSTRSLYLVHHTPPCVRGTCCCGLRCCWSRPTPRRRSSGRRSQSRCRRGNSGFTRREGEARARVRRRGRRARGDRSPPGPSCRGERTECPLSFGRYVDRMPASLWRRRAAIVVFLAAYAALLLAPAPLWLRLVGITAAVVCYWRYAWKYQGIRERTLEAWGANGDASDGRPQAKHRRLRECA